MQFLVKFVINLTQWPLDEDHTLSVRTELAGTYELDRTRDDTDVEQRLTDADIKHERPDSYDPRRSLLHPMLPERLTCRC